MQYFEEIYETYYHRVYTFLFKLCGNKDEAEDLTQETFYQAYTSWYKFRGKSQVLTWLIAIAKRVFYKFLQKKKRSLETVDLSAIVDIYSSNLPSPLQEVERADTEAALKNLIKTLPAKYRDVIMLRIYGQLTFAQVGQILKISENSAKVIYFRAKKKLTEELSHETTL